jgi:hypothetical protein
MSWGFFAHLRVGVAPEAWSSLKKKKPADLGLRTDWAGFADPELRAALTVPKQAIGKTLDRLEEDGALVEAEPPDIRVLALLDRSQLDLAAPLAALMLAAGNGSLELVNDRTFHGSAGRRLEVRDGALVGADLPDDDELADALAAELVPPAPSNPFAPVRREPPPVTTDPGIALRESFDLYKSGHTAEARDYLRRYLAAGRAPRADIWHYFVAFLRAAPPDPIGPVLDQVEATYTEHPALLREAASLENAIALLNTHGRAKGSLSLAYGAVRAGLAWNRPLVATCCHSAWVAADPVVARELLAQLDPLPAALAGDGAVHTALAAACWRAGDREGTLASLERAVALDPAQRAPIAGDPDWAPLHADPRWGRLVG